MSPADPGPERAWSWVAHLREGGTVAWRDWPGGTPMAGRVLPGAQQLELLRRLNLAAARTGRGRTDPALAERVLTASAPGRGRPDLPLAGAGPESPFGPRPVDPTVLPDKELIRVATSLIADDLVAQDVRPAPDGAWSRPWRRRYHLLGDPLAAHQLRRHLRSVGRPPGGRSATVLLLAGPVDTVLADTWTRRVFEHGASAWPDWLRFWRERNQLPPRADLLRVAEHWERRVGRERLRVVVDHRELPGLLGVRSLPATVRPGEDTVELARQVASVLGVLVPGGTRERLLTHALWPRLVEPARATGATPDPHPAIGVPDEHADWVARRATRLARRLQRAGYPVVGDPAGLAPSGRPAVAADASSGRVLELALGLLLDQPAPAGATGGGA